MLEYIKITKERIAKMWIKQGKLKFLLGLQLRIFINFNQHQSMC